MFLVILISAPGHKTKISGVHLTTAQDKYLVYVMVRERG
ncbi:hypothetical protein PRUB_a5177 [Pseudoalteromonas rubra]|uniref:Uncharacterized protein n=1 Tax=Pseudoalteromonas rubra TaxID=43658 RepID=A0A8T0CA99_9GAMM|nr:hypothetical protein PRUB_a5177 [Pseudoalteromonas rubra]